MSASVMLMVRRNIMILMIIIGALSIIPLSALAQNCGGRGGPLPGSSGTKFLLVFMKNEEASYDEGPTMYQDIYLASIDTFAHTTVTITCRAFPGWSKVIDLPPHGSYSYRITTDPVIGFPNQDAIVEIPEIVDPTVFKVVASAPITCYGMNNKKLTSDAFLALPFDESTNEYRVMAYFNSTVIDTKTPLPPGVLPNNKPSEFAVASFEDNNTVTIIPSAVTSTGSQKGKPLTFILDSGQCVQIEGDIHDSLGDMTGSIVRSTRPVAVYGGNARTESPTGFTIDNNTSRDHLCEAMPPLSTWGYSFIAKNFGRADGDLLRVLASVDSTIVKINGKQWGAPLNANQFRDTVIAQSVIALNNIAVVESTEPILVGMIAHTADVTSSTGDPFLAIVPPLQQTYNDFTYFITTDTVNYNPNQQFLIIATEKSGAGKISIDTNKPIPAAVYTMLPNPINGKFYAVTTFKQKPGIHRIVSSNPLPENGFTILAFGWGNVISYGYTAGQLLVPLKGLIPLPSLTRNVAPGPGDPSPSSAPSIIVRNILSEKIYFDSARVFYSQNSRNIAVRLKKDIAMETGTIQSAEEKTLELTTSIPASEVITGKIRIWYHTAKWTNLMPVDFPYVISPQSQAGVGVSGIQAVVLENYPNPSMGRTTVHYVIPEGSYGSVKLYDALGRMVRTIRQGMLISGDQEIVVPTKGLVAGEYTLELSVPELGISEHRKMIVAE